MPIYEYQCERCHHHLEALQKISDKPLRECPECGRHTLKRLLSAPLFRLAGSGWYETDFKSDKENRRNLAGRDEAPAGDGAARESTSQASAADKKPAAPSAGDGKERGARKTIVPKPSVKASAKPKAAKTARAKAGKPARRR
jgi:putative FmdB family regulatory protein